MPYTIEKNDAGEFCVYRKDEDGAAMGETLGCHATEAEAIDQIGAIESNENETRETGGRSPGPRVGQVSYLRCYAQRQAPGGEDDAGPVRFVASTEGPKRDGLDLRAADWELSNYLRHPVVLWAHDYRERLPLGTGRPVFEGNTLMIDVEFDREDEFAQTVRRKARKGLVAGSVGWDTRKDGKNELLEFSMVPVPADPDALPLREAMGLRALQRAIDEVLGDERSDGEAGWRQTAARMVEVFDSDAEEPDRRRDYNRLARDYRRYGRTAPEYAPRETWQALTAHERAAWWLEGEIGREIATERAGAMLSQRNRDALEQAMGLIQGVLERAAKEETGDGSRETEETALQRLHQIMTGKEKGK